MEFFEKMRRKRQTHKEKRRQFKTNAKKTLKRNYIACLAVCFIMTFAAGEYSTTVKSISAYNNRHVANLKFSPEEKKEIVLDMKNNGKTPEQASKDWNVDNPGAVKQWKNAYEELGNAGLEKKELTFFGSSQDSANTEDLFDVFSSAASVKEKISNSLGNASQTVDYYFETVMAVDNTYQSKLGDTIASVAAKKDAKTIALNFGGFLASLLFAVFITSLLMVCERRFFLENRTYKKTKPGRLGFLFRERTIHPAKTMFVKNIYYTLWSLTIIGAFIKSYSYALVPFILAENPDAKTNKVITLSRRMMNGHKWELFKMDVSMLGWSVLSLLSFGVVGIFFVNPYTTSVKTEFYISLRKEAIKNGIEGSDILNDKYLDLDLLEEQMQEKAKSYGNNPDSASFSSAFTVYIPESENEMIKEDWK